MKRRLTIIPSGDFESGTSSGWTSFSSLAGTGLFRPSNELPFDGRFSFKGLVELVGKNSQFSTTREVSVQAGESYVLSAFFNTTHQIGVTYIDLQDSSFEPHIGDSKVDSVRAPGGIATWQFAWAVFKIPMGVTKVTVRIVRDEISQIGEYGFVDDVAITPAMQFVPPIPASSQQPSLKIATFASVEIEGTVGRIYRIEYSTSIPNANWIRLTEIRLPSSPFFYLDLGSASNARRFYRAVAVEP